MTLLEEGQIEIHTENIFPIIKKAVYSDHEIFLRELVSNGVDAISKRRMASIADDCEPNEEARISIRIDREANTLTVSDNGIGMTEEEVKRYINQVAFSSAEEFLSKYKQEKEGIIGHFGLGFYSSFMVAKQVELITRSARKDSVGIKWTCDGSPKFKLSNHEREESGTDVILYLMDEELEYLEPTRIKGLITKYCDFMPVEVYLNDEVINKRDPAWRKSPKDLSKQDYIDLYRYLYPFQGDPLLWIHLNTDYPYNLQGILFFPKLTGRADWEKGEIKLYCNQVFVSDSIKEIVPRYLLPLRGVVDSPDIPLNVSRSALQTDRRVRSIGNFISKKVADRLKALKKDEPEFYAEIWESLSPFIKIGVMEDEKFADQIEENILFAISTADKTDSDQAANGKIVANGNYYSTINDYISSSKDKDNKKILYCTDEIAQASALNLWKTQGYDVIKAETVIDTQFIPWLEDRHSDLKFQRVDSEIDDELKDEKIEVSDEQGKTKSDELHKLIKEALNNEKISIQVQSLKGENAPASMILLPEQMRRINDIGALMEQRLPGLPDHHVLLINSSHPLVKNLLQLEAGSVFLDTEQSSSSGQLTKSIALYLYDLAKLGVGGLEPSEVADFQERSTEMIKTLIERGL